MKTVTILLTKYSDFFGRFISKISRDGYSHASISIDESEEIFYSFNLKGFAIEKPKKRVPKLRRPGSACIRIQVPENIYALLQEQIQQFLDKKEEYKYSSMGVVLCLLHIPCKFKMKYFCSQFVAELLSKAGAVDFKKRASLYLPNQLLDGIESPYAQKQIVFNTF